MRYQKTDLIFCEPFVGEHSCQISAFWEISFLLIIKFREVVVIRDLVKKGSKMGKNSPKKPEIGLKSIFVLVKIGPTWITTAYQNLGC